MTLKALDLFCGAGGFSTGLEMSGIEIVVAIDYDENALKTHKLNHPNTTHYKIDLLRNDALEILIKIFKKHDIDILIGSPPCQNFSNANSSKDEEIGMKLVDLFIDFAQSCDFKYWIGENVRGVKKHVENKNLKIKTINLNSINYGVAQRRVRTFFGDFPTPRPSSRIKKTINQILLEDFEKKAVNFIYFKYNRQRRFIDEDYQRRTGFPHSKILDPNSSSRTITAHHDNIRMYIVYGESEKKKNEIQIVASNSNNYFNIENSKIRKITTRELKLLMGFPSNYRFYGPSTSKIKQIGNSVTPPLAKALGKAMLFQNKIKLIKF